MPKRQKYVPKHRAPSAATVATDAPRRVLRSTVVFSGLAVTATAGVVGTGVVGTPLSVSSATDQLQAVNPLSETELAERDAAVSRSDSRAEADPAKEAALEQAALDQAEAAAFTRTEDLSTGDPRDIARALLPEFGYSADQFGCLDSLYMSESGWRVDADNPTSSAYGIPQALTETHDLPAGYMTDAEVQIRWGLEYIQSRYGSPCNAWSFKQGHNWY